MANDTKTLERMLADLKAPVKKTSSALPMPPTSTVSKITTLPLPQKSTVSKIAPLPLPDKSYQLKTELGTIGKQIQAIKANPSIANRNVLQNLQIRMNSLGKQIAELDPTAEDYRAEIDNVDKRIEQEQAKGPSVLSDNKEELWSLQNQRTTASGNLWTQERKEKYAAVEASPDFAEKSIGEDRPDMTDEENAVYNYLLNTQGDKAAKEYKEYAQYAINERKRKSEAEKIQNAMETIPGVAHLANNASFVTKALSGLGYVGAAGQKIVNTITGNDKPVDYNTTAFIPANITDAVRGSFSDKLAAKTDAKILGQNAASAAYNTGMSIGDFLAVSPLGSTAALAIMGTSAATSATQDAKERGATDEQALAVGLVSGAAEAIFEKFSLENFKALQAAGKPGAWNFIKDVAKQSFTEGSEEFFTTIANTISDAFIMGDKSAINLAIQNYRAQGLSLEEATRKAYTDAANGLAMDTLGGILSGGFVGSVGAVQGRQANAQPTMEQSTTQPSIEPVQAVQEVQQPIQEVQTVQPETQVQQPETVQPEAVQPEPVQPEAMQPVQGGDPFSTMLNKAELDDADFNLISQNIRRSKGISALKDVSRVLDDAAWDNKALRQVLYQQIEKPYNEAGGKYGKAIKQVATDFKNQMDSLGIKADSKESKAAQRYGEGQYQDVDGALIEYTLDDLKRDFPDSWERIVKAESIMRKTYDDYVDSINGMLTKIYPNAQKNAETRVSSAQKNIDTAMQRLEKANSDVKLVQDAIAKKQAQIDKTVRLDTKRYSDLQYQLKNLKTRESNYKEAVAKADMAAVKAQAQMQDAIDAISSGEVYRNKRLLKRKDYFHHFQEMSQGYEALFNILNAPHDISANLAVKSEYTRPKTKWEGFMQERGQGKYKEDAVGGMVKYISAAEYKLAYDPVTAKLRDFENKLDSAMTANDARNANDFKARIDSLANTLAGKTNEFDRWMDKLGSGGRTLMKSVEWLNRRVRANAVLGNFRSAVSQIYNIPNATSMIKNPVDWMAGTKKAALAMVDPDMQNIIGQSDFLSNRYSNNVMEKFEEGLLKQPKKAAMWMLEIGDRKAAELIWWSAYSEYQRTEGRVDGFRGYENATDYADDITRRSVGGRGVGEVPPLLASKTAQLLAPFQIEVNNSMQNLIQQVGKKNVGGIVAFEVSTYLLNLISQSLFGASVGGFDFIGAVIDAIKYAFDDDKEDKAIYAAQRLAGEFVGGLPGSSLLGAVIGPETSKTLFGEEDPSRFGTGNIGAKALAEIAALPFKKNVDAMDVLKTASPVMLPWGGTQLARTIEGVSTVAQGGSYGTDADGNKTIQFPVEQTAKNYAQAAAFGKYSLPTGKKWIDTNFPTMSAEKTKAYQEWKAAGKSGVDFLTYEDKIKKMEPVKDAKGNILASANQRARQMLNNDTKLTPEEKQTLDQALICSGTERAKDYTDQYTFKMSTDGSGVYDRYKKVQKYNISSETYYQYWEKTKDLKPDTYGGETVDGSLKLKKVNVIDSLKLSDKQKYALYGQEKYEDFTDVYQAGISYSVYSNYWQSIQDIHGDGKKDKIISLIDAMDLTDQQKRLIAAQSGYEKNIPW